MVKWAVVKTWLYLGVLCLSINARAGLDENLEDVFCKNLPYDINFNMQIFKSFDANLLHNSLNNKLNFILKILQYHYRQIKNFNQLLRGYVMEANGDLTGAVGLINGLLNPGANQSVAKDGWQFVTLLDGYSSKNLFKTKLLELKDKLNLWLDGVRIKICEILKYNKWNKARECFDLLDNISLYIEKISMMALAL